MQFFLGNYNSSNGLVKGKEALSVAGVAGIYYLIFAMICFGLANGILMLMSRKAGANDAKGVGYVFSAGVQLGLVVVLILWLISFLFSNNFFSFSIQNSIVMQLAQEFIAIRIWGLPFLFLAHLGNMLYIATDKTKFMLYGTLGQTIANVVLDYFLIFGNGLFPEWGVAGAAIASVVSEIIFCLIVLGIILYNKSFKEFQVSLFRKVQRTDFYSYFKKSSPLMLQYFISIGAWEVFFVFVEHLGERQLGASQIIRSVYGIMGILIWALSNTTNSLVSNLYSQHKYDEIIPLIKRICILSVTYAFIVALIIFIFNKEFLGLYTSDAEMIALAQPSLFIVLLASLIFSFSNIYFNALLGLGNTRRSLVYESFTIACYLIYCYFVIEKNKPMLWVAWASEYVYWITMLVLSGVYLHSRKWIPKSKL